MHIDVHAHFFNTRYIPIAGVLRKWFPSVSSGLARFVDFGITVLTANDRALDKAPGPGEVQGLHDDAQEQSGKAQEYKGTIAERGMERSRAEVGEDEAVDWFVERLPDEALESRFFDDFAKEYGVGSNAFVETEPLEGPERRRELLRSALVAERNDAFAIESVGEKLGTGIQFFLNMITSERRLYNEARKNAPEVGLFVAHMMDMEPSYEDECYYSWGRCMRRTRELARLGEGRIVPFIAFDPGRQSGFDAVEEALRNGFAGVKFYPPSGYRAHGNPDPGVDAANRRLFAHCSEAGVPILAHCSPRGMQVDRRACSGHNADPDHWEPVLAEFPRLRVCFGHFGGEDRWFGAPTPSSPCDTPKPEWTEKVVRLCCQYENVYCDVSHFTQILERGVPRAVANTLAQLGQGRERLFEKVMYGSDFPMPCKAGGWKNYHECWEEVFDGALRRHREHFFRQNAVNYLNLPGYVRRSGAALGPKARKHLESI